MITIDRKVRHSYRHISPFINKLAPTKTLDSFYPLPRRQTNYNSPLTHPEAYYQQLSSFPFIINGQLKIYVISLFTIRGLVLNVDRSNKQYISHVRTLTLCTIYS